MLVLVDAGIKISGYRSDITRTWWFGSTPSSEFQKVETVIKNAYQTAKNFLDTSVKTKCTAAEVDKAARDVINAAGYGSNFIHSTGHGIGFDIHELPSLNWNSSVQILPQMVMTIEPGIYLADHFGYRHENTLLVTADGSQELTHV